MTDQRGAVASPDVARWPFAVRGALADELGARIAAGESVLIDGAPGSGRTRLATEIAHRLQRQGWTVATVRGTASAQGLPFGPVAHLLPSVLPSAAVNPVRWAADQLLAELPRRRVLLVDDVHRLDAASAALLVHLVEHRRVPVLATASAAVPDAVGDAVRSGVISRVDLPPLHPDEVAELLDRVLPGGVVPTTARRLAEFCEGNPLWLIEVLRIAKAHGVMTGPPWRLIGSIPTFPPALAGVLSQRWGALEDADVELVELIALAEPIDAAQLEILVPPPVIVAGERRGLIRSDRRGDRVEVWLSHALFGEVVRSGSQQLTLRHRFRALAETAGRAGEPVDALRVAWWRRQAGLPQTGDELVVAARIAWAVHDHTRALELAQAAWESRVSVDAGILLATVLQHSGQVQRAAELLAEIHPAELEPRLRTDFALTSAQNLMHRGDVGSATAVVDQTAAVIEEREPRQDLEVARLMMLASTGDLAGARRLGRAMLADASLGPAVRAQATNVVVIADLVTGRAADAVAAIDRVLAEIAEWRALSPSIAVTLFFNRVQAALLLGRLNDADRALADLDAETARRQEFPFADQTLAVGRGQVLLARGRLADAVAVLRTVQAGPLAAVGQSELAVALTASGRFEEARVAVALARSQPPSPSPLATLAVMTADSWAVAMESGTGEAADRAVTAARSLQDRGLSAPALWLLHLAVRWGAAGAISDRVEALAADMQGDHIALVAAHARAAAAGDGSRLMGVAEMFAASGFLPLAVDAAAQGAQALADEHGPATAATRNAAARARRWAEQCGALRTPALARLDAPGLTEREAEVARLAAAGWTSQRIADRFTLSVRTVDNHLQRAYTKLGVSGRRDLAGLLTPDGPAVPPRNPG